METVSPAPARVCPPECFTALFGTLYSTSKDASTNLGPRIRPDEDSPALLTLDAECENLGVQLAESDPVDIHDAADCERSTVSLYRIYFATGIITFGANQGFRVRVLLDDLGGRALWKKRPSALKSVSSHVTH